MARGVASMQRMQRSSVAGSSRESGLELSNMAQLTSQQHCLPCSGHCRSPSQACRPRQAACAAAVREDPQPSGRREAFAAAAGAVLLACSSSRAAQAEEVKVEPITKKGALKPLENKAKSEAPAASPDGTRQASCGH